MEPDFSGGAFLGQEPNPVQKVDEEGVAFHMENQMPPTVAILDLGCTRDMGSRNAVNAFCGYVDKHDCGLWYEIEETSSGFFFANSQQTKCAEKLVIHIYDKAWNAHTEFDISEEGNVPTDEKPCFSIWALTTEVTPYLYKTRNLEASTQDVKEHSLSHGLPRHCLVWVQCISKLLR